MQKLIRQFVLMTAGCLLTGVILWLSFRPASYTQRPLSEAPIVHRVTPENWATLVTSGGPGEVPWILLPETEQQPPFKSTVKAEQRGFLKPEVCGECHQSNHTSFMTTAHARTSVFPDQTTIHGRFDEADSEMSTADPNMNFRMISNADGFHQLVTYTDHHSRTQYRHDFRFDLVLGSGNHGQSYLYWEGDRLYQMHVSYLTEVRSWVNSPGPYYDGTADFARPIPSRCLDCHVTWIAFDGEEVNRFDRDTLIPGVTCVRCHGPGHEHVAFHRKFPDEKDGRRIVNPSKLSVQQINELCAQCHSAGEPIGPAFGYRPGDPLASWLTIDFDADASSNADPHSANQLARLMKSRCFQETGGISCIQCHDPHENQIGKLSDYSRRCQTCHKSDSCNTARQIGPQANDRCVDCHMPTRRDALVEMETATGNVQALLRDHQIGVWKEASEHVRAEVLKLDTTVSLPNNSDSR